MKTSEEFDKGKEMILRDYLAVERTRLANERTLFAYIRTALYLLTVGIGIFEIRSIWHLKWLGWICLLLSIIILPLGIVRFIKIKKHLTAYTKQQENQKNIEENHTDK